jgi:hypothetical protein
LARGARLGGGVVVVVGGDRSEHREHESETFDDWWSLFFLRLEDRLEAAHLDSLRLLSECKLHSMIGQLVSDQLPSFAGQRALRVDQSGARGSAGVAVVDGWQCHPRRPVSSSPE